MSRQIPWKRQMFEGSRNTLQFWSKMQTQARKRKQWSKNRALYKMAVHTPEFWFSFSFISKIQNFTFLIINAYNIQNFKFIKTQSTYYKAISQQQKHTKI